MSGPIAPRPPADILALGIMALRGALYFLLRLRRPRLVLMDRGARIKGLRNIEFRGPAKIGAYASIDARYCNKMLLGRNFSLGDFSIMRASGSHSFRCPGVSIGDHVSFGPYCNVGGGFGLEVGDNCLFGPYVSLHPESHVTERADLPIRLQGVAGQGIVIGADNWFGTKATVLDGARIGEGNIVAAGALLTRKEWGSRNIFAGLPAKQVGVRT